MGSLWGTAPIKALMILFGLPGVSYIQCNSNLYIIEKATDHTVAFCALRASDILMEQPG
jgi:hypothetical protein